MQVRHEIPLWLRKALIWVGILIALILIIFPEIITDHLSFLHIDESVTSKLFSAIFAILLAILSFVQESIRTSLSMPSRFSGLGYRLPELETNHASRNSEPHHMVIIATNLPSFKQR